MKEKKKEKFIKTLEEEFKAMEAWAIQAQQKFKSDEDIKEVKELLGKIYRQARVRAWRQARRLKSDAGKKNQSKKKN